jgi:hypothetical protein
MTSVAMFNVNPFAPPPRHAPMSDPQQRLIYEPLDQRAQGIIRTPEIQEAIESLTARLGGKQYQQHHFGRLELLPLVKIDINVDIQRLLEKAHIGQNIITLFDPRIMQPLNVIYIKETGRYSAWEGQQSGTAFALMLTFGLIDPATLIQCKVVDDDLEVPGSDITGEAVGNFGFRCVNYKGRKEPDLYYIFRSMVNGVRLYGSDLREDRQADQIQTVLEAHRMFAAPAVAAQGTKAKPGMISHVSAMLKIAGHDTSDKEFAETLKDLEWCVAWHNRYYASEKGVDGGYLLTFGRFARLCREQGITMTRELELDFARHMKRYGSPKAFHDDCKQRYKKWAGSGWKDACLLPIWIKDYLKRGGSQPLPKIPHYDDYRAL